jgi:uncharacterized protein YndB with AHSA1/START domain
MKNGFNLSAPFPVSPETVYKAWLDSRKHGLMTGDKATCSARVGGKFTAWSGYISGKNLELEPYSRIMQSWRTTEFAKSDPDSRVEIRLKPAATGCTFKLKHTNIPRGQVDNYRKGWKEFYLSPMREYFWSTKKT